MKQVPSDKYSIAWFKLAECISRGEKERALGVYRLLSHSLDNPALACQLEGDILFSFNDTEAHAKYVEAAQLYQQNERFFEAAAIFEHLLTIEPHAADYRKLIITLYKQLRITSKAQHHLHSLCEQAIADSRWQEASCIADEYSELKDTPQTGQLHEKLIYLFLQDNPIPQELILKHVKKAIDGFFSDDNKLAEFVTKLAAIDETIYNEAFKYLEEKNKQAPK